MNKSEVSYRDIYPKHIIKKWCVLPYFIYNISEDYTTRTHTKNILRSRTIKSEVFCHFSYKYITALTYPKACHQIYTRKHIVEWVGFSHIYYNILPHLPTPNIYPKTYHRNG